MDYAPAPHKTGGTVKSLRRQIDGTAEVFEACLQSCLISIYPPPPNLKPTIEVSRE